MSKVDVTKVEATNALITLSNSARYSRHADSSNPVSGLSPRLRHRATAAADFAGCSPGEPGIVVSGVAPSGGKGLAASRMAAVGNRTRSQILFAHAGGPEAACRGKGELESPRRRCPVDLQRRGVGHAKNSQFAPVETQSKGTGPRP